MIMFNETASKDKLKLFKPWPNLVVVDLVNKSRLIPFLAAGFWRYFLLGTNLQPSQCSSATKLQDSGHGGLNWFNPAPSWNQKKKM